MEFAFFGALTPVGALFNFTKKKGQKTMKKILSLLLAVACAFALVISITSCSGDDGANGETSQKVTEEEFVNAFSMSCDFTVAVSGVEVEIEDDENERYEVTETLTYASGVFTRERSYKIYEDGDLIKEDTKTSTKEYSESSVYKIINLSDALDDSWGNYIMSLSRNYEGSMDFSAMYEKFEYSDKDKCYVAIGDIKDGSHKLGECEVKLYFKDSKISKMIISCFSSGVEGGDQAWSEEFNSTLTFSYN